MKWKEGNWEVASEFFEQELKLDPFSYLARYGLAEVSFHRKDLAKALSYLNDAAKIRPEFFEPFPTFWISLPKEELNPLRLRILESSPSGSFASTFLLAAVAAQLGDSSTQTSALRDAERSLGGTQEADSYCSEDSDAPSAEEQEGLKLLREKRYEAGSSLLLPFARKTELEPELLVPLARALLSLKENHGASEILRSYANRRSDDPEPHYLLGISYQFAANAIMQAR